VTRWRAAGLGLGLAVSVALGLGGLHPAAGAGFGRITPGETTRKEVEGEYGKPSREATVLTEGRTVAEWTYLSGRAPKGITRMVIAFGLIRNEQFEPDLVRSLTLYPDAGVFPLKALTNGWGEPAATAKDSSTGRTIFRYAGGLFVALDRTGRWAEVMTFAPAPPR